MRSLIGLLAVVGVVGFGCSSSSSDGGAGGSAGGSSVWNNSCSPTGQTQTCTGEAAYEQCLMTACNAQMQAAFGSGVATGVLGGPCASYITCQNNCPCDANNNTCKVSCQNNMPAACQTPFTNLTSCVLSASCTLPQCTPAGGTGGSTGTGGAPGTGGTTGLGGSTGTYTCAQLGACCATMTNASIQSTCTAVVGTANESSCSSAYAGFKSGALCP
jgi:hypothetical protein